MESGQRRRQPLVVASQSAETSEPAERSLDDPAPRVNGEADLIGVLAHDLDRDQRGLGDLLTGIPTIGEDALDAAGAARSRATLHRSDQSGIG